MLSTTVGVVFGAFGCDDHRLVLCVTGTVITECVLKTASSSTSGGGSRD